ncbi:MAG TPA: hypothetical protein PK014_07450 [Thermoanaerobaculia bacterium]|nr:hypothetical protein [Thermoanaerobaculia bacterium]
MSHARFSYTVSVHHVMEEKGCHPEGCIYLRWSCKKIQKQEKCPRGYRHAGRKCGGCQHFYDIKEAYRPELVLKGSARDDFFTHYRHFKWWVDEIEGTRVSFFGRVALLKPCYVKIVRKRGEFFRSRGLLAVFHKGYIGRTHFQDRLYLNLTRSESERLQIFEGQELEGEAQLSIDRGRFILSRPRRMAMAQQKQSSDHHYLDLMLRIGSKTFRDQPERCVACSRGILVDVLDGEDNQRFLGRELLCLEGVASPKDCLIGTDVKDRLERCARERHSA